MTCKRASAFLLLVFLAMGIPLTLAADGAAMMDPGLIGTWSWVSAETPAGSLSPVDGAEYTVTFTEDGSVYMKFEINSINGGYEADGMNLTIIPPMAMTLAAWQPGSTAPALLKLLEASREYTVSGNDLTIVASSAAGSTMFVRQ